jgi:hypothetical protein
MNKEVPQTFADRILELQQQFCDGGHPAESDAQIADAILDHILERERLRHRVVGGTPAADAVDNATLSTMAEWDTDDPALSHLEKALRRFASGRGVDAVTLLKRAITTRQQAVSDDQRRRASMPREPDPLDKLIETLVAETPNISAKKLEATLRREIGKGVIANMSDNHIDLADRSRGPVKVSGLKDRLTRAKRKIAKAG